MWTKDYEGYLATNPKVTTYIGNYYEIQVEGYVQPTGGTPSQPCNQTYCAYFPYVSNTVTENISYYYADGQRIAMKNNGVVSYLYGDQLGSVSAVADDSGALVSKTFYHPWGTTRYTQSTNPTDYAYTGQMKEGDIYFYNARYYDPQIGRFIQADTIVPPSQGTQGFDRFAYVNNNPLSNTDPSGHRACDGIGSVDTCETIGANDYLAILRYSYGWSLNGAGWGRATINTFLDTAEIISNNGISNMRRLFGDVSFNLEEKTYSAVAAGNTISINKSTTLTKWTLTHELGHVVDWKSGWQFSKDLEVKTGGSTHPLRALWNKISGGSSSCNTRMPGCNASGYYFGGTPARGADYNFNREEDFAETFTARVFPFDAGKEVSQYLNTKYMQLFYGENSTKLRGQWISGLIIDIINP